MAEASIVSVVALLGCLVLVLSAYRAHRIDAKKSVVLALQWAAIFLAVVWVFSLLGV